MKIFTRALLFSPFLVVAAYALVASVYKPHHYWDKIMYIASAKSFEENDPAALQAFAYNAVRASVPEREYAGLISEGYRHTISTDVSAFEEQLPFYQIRPIFNGVVYLLYKSGIEIGTALHLVAGVSVALAVVLLYFISTACLREAYVYAVPFLALVFGVVDIARTPNPDGLALLAVILAAYLFLKRRMVPLLVFLPIMMGVRTDLILFAVPLQLFMLLQHKRLRVGIMLSMLSTAGVCWAIGTCFNNPGWATIFYFTLVEILPHPLTESPTLTVAHYCRVLIREAVTLLDNQTFVLYGLVVMFSLREFMRRAAKTSLPDLVKSPPILLSVVCMLYFAGHFMLFPVAWNRFFSGTYTLGSICLLSMLSGKEKDGESI